MGGSVDDANDSSIGGERGSKFARARRHFPWAMLVILLLTAGLLGLSYWAAQPAPIRIAFANSMTGIAGFAGQQSLVATRLYIDEVNRAGGINGHPIELMVFDDKSSGDTATANVAAIADSPCVAVLGHYLSGASVAAGPLYRDAKIPALTGQSAADEVTAGNPYYFSAQTPNRYQGEFLAEYINSVFTSRESLYMSAPDIDFVYSGDAFGRSLLNGYTLGNGGKAPRAWEVEPGKDKLAASLQAAAEALAKEPEPRIIIIGVSTDIMPNVIVGLRRAGIHSIMFLSAGGANVDILKALANEPEERDTPGFFAQNLYAEAPLLLDSAGEAGQEFAAAYARRTGDRAGWIPAKANDAARLIVAALRRANIRDVPTSKAEDREKIRATLAGIDNPSHAVIGLDGPLYFSNNRDMPRPMRLGSFQSGRLITSPLQLVLVADPTLVDLDSEMKKGNIVQIGDSFYWLQRVVYAGIDINQLDRVDVRNSSFNVDFYLWMLYGGDGDDPTHVTFPDLKDVDAFDPAHPLESGMQSDLNYRLYRVTGDFKQDFDLHDYPFDQQNLLIRFQNTNKPRQEIAYVIDTFGLHVDDASNARVNPDAFRGLQLWHLNAVRPFVDYVSTSSTLGKPSLIANDNRTEYAGFDTEIQLRRDYIAFMIKTLMPLFLLVLVVFATLFFPNSLTKERTTIPVTGILTSAVLMISINSQLPAIGYTVAIEYIFYVFFALCLMAMITGFLTEILRNKKRHGVSVALDVGSKLVYATTVFVTAGIYFWLYARA
jgi:ABC-type branched-subunit amino acid transport system substrate-binding protein